MTDSAILKRIEYIRRGIKTGVFKSYYSGGDVVNDQLKEDMQLLFRLFSTYFIRVIAEFPEHTKQIGILSTEIKQLHLDLKGDLGYRDYVEFADLEITKILEFLDFINKVKRTSLDEKTVSFAVYNKQKEENETLKNINEFLVQSKGLPELTALIKHANDNSLPIDEYWVLALCSSNLIEAVVNRKLEKLGEKADGNFEDRYKKLCKIIKEKEGRDIPQILPSAIYKVRNKLDHSSDSNRVTPKEARNISQMVIDFMNEVLQ